MTQILAISRRRFLAVGLGSLVASVCVQNPGPIALPGLPSPKFWFGQRVKTSWVNDDRLDTEHFGKIYWIGGFVIGLVFDHPDSGFLKTQWWYYIRFDSGCEFLKQVSEVNSCPEEDLELLA